MSMYNSAQNVTVLGQVATFLWQVTMGSSWGMFLDAGEQGGVSELKGLRDCF